MPTRILIVDDDPLVRVALRTILAGHPDLTVVGEAGDGASALATARETAPDLVLLDIRMAGVDGVAATGLLRGLPSPPRVLILTAFDSEDFVLRSLRLGADGYLLKDTPPDRIVESVRAVAAGRAVLSPAATRRVVDRMRDGVPGDRRAEALRRLAGLTPREREVAVAVAAGASNTEIARALHVSEATVKTHIARLFEKLPAASRVHIATFVVEAGWPESAC